ncbi:MAG: PAS domain-containing protein [Verrucomicrobia bacterium]|nr:PAS domain-containing protein [Verrucomicrobiota bacterium]MCH8527320.1 PAS domain-containing protein [Kiritimatiellia bacterium]
MKDAAQSRSGIPTTAGAPEPAASAESKPFPIIGIGASAGGLDALEQFLEQVPDRSGMAFVIVQHLDPTHKGIMAELLQRSTAMSVVQVEDCATVNPDCVYVIPPNKDMSILQGVLHLLEPAAPRGLRLPIDYFLRSLAEDRREHSIGVILSGMGSDGTLGLRAIKETAGAAFVQDPLTAKFDSMPRSAIDAGLADIVAAPGALAGKITAYLKGVLNIPSAERPAEDRARGTLEKILVLIRARSGHDYSLYKRNTIVRRIERRMGLHQIDSMATYVRYLQENPSELDLLFKELLIGVTRFFRDPAMWEALEQSAVQALLQRRGTDPAPLRAWVPGCSTGEEAFSLAILLKETAGRLNPEAPFTLKLFATDLDRDAIDKARQGLFPENIAADVSPERLSRFFTKEDHGYRVCKEIREMVVFAPQDIIRDPPFTRLDLVSCRNLLIYLTAEVQKKLMPLFHYSLNPGGILMLGSAETVGSTHDLFLPLNGKLRIFQRTDTAPGSVPVQFPASFSAPSNAGNAKRGAAKAPESLQSAADQLVLQQYAPPSALTNDRGDILYIRGRTGKYLEPAAGKANWNIFAMAREGLRYELDAAFQKALRMEKGEAVTVVGSGSTDQGRAQGVNIRVERLETEGPLQGLVMILFNDVEASAVPPGAETSHQDQTRSVRFRELEMELERVRHEARGTHEEMQTAQEELRSTNEELQSANEELQSTNEELTTSHEEMQSLNEELQTVNAEMQAKVDELSRVGNDMKNLLDSTDIATLFLDNDLNVRRYTALTKKIIKLIPGDVGRPLSDLASELNYPELADDAREVLRSLAACEKPIPTRDDRWFTVRIMPYRTLDDRIDGVVITFTDITVAKTLEAQLRERQSVLEQHVADHAGNPPRKPKQPKP